VFLPGFRKIVRPLDSSYRALNHTSEERLGNEKVGTTLRGIGPAYEDKAGRRGIRTADALVPDVLSSRIDRNLEDANRIIEAYGGERLDAKEIFNELSVLTERLAPFIADTTHFLNIAATEGRSILLSPGYFADRIMALIVRHLFQLPWRHHRQALPQMLTGVLGAFPTTPALQKAHFGLGWWRVKELAARP
jgi:hypothetical protein